MAEDYVLQTKITADSTSFDKGIKSAQNSLKGISSSISSVMKLAGGLFAIGSIAQLGKALSDMSQSYAKATQNIVRGTGAVGEQLKTLQKSVNASLINGVGRDASELGEMVADLNTRLGVTGDTLTELVSQFDDFSDVTGTDTKTAINSVSDVLAKWNIETSQAVPLLDQLTYASQASGASVIELTNGLKSGQAVFSQFGMSATESIAFLGTLKKNGIETSSAIMGMKTALANFAKSGLDAKTAFAEISESIKNAGSQTEALSIATKVFGQRNGAEFVRVLSGGTEGVDAFTEALENAGGSLARTNEASRTSADAMRDLKATIAGVFSTSGTDNGLRDLIDDIARAIRNLDFTSIKETFSNIGLFIKGVWGQIKELFNRLSGAIGITGGNFKIFADIIYENLNHAYQVIQDFVGMISAILDGDWSVAWDYAKLIVLRTVKQMEESINNAIKLMPNLFNSVIEGYNWVLEQQDKLFLEVFHLPEKYFKSAKLPKFEGKDLIDTKSIDEAIEKARKTIESKTGKIADNTLKDLKRQKEAVHATTQAITGDIGSLGTAVEDTTETTGSKVSGFFEEWGKQYEDLAGNWNKTFTDMANIGTQAMGDMFTQIGEGLVNGGNGFEEYSAMAVKAVAEILKSLSAQLSAEAAVAAAHYDYATAAAAAAGAAAALVAAGTLTAVASNMKKTSDAAKDASMSLEEFRKKLNEIWAGETTSISVVVSIRKIDDAVKNTTKSVEKASAEYEEWNARAKKASDIYQEFSKTVTSSGMAQHAAELRRTAENLKFIANTYKDKLSVEQKKLKEAQESYLKGLRETEDELKNQIKEYEELNKEYQTLYGSLNGYTSEMVRSQAIVSKYASIVRKEMLANTKSLLNTVYNSFSSYGKTIGENLMDSIVNGATKSDFLNNIKEYVRKQMLQLAIYTDSFTSEIADIGTQMVKSLMSDGTGLDVLTDRLEDLYERTSEIAGKIDETLEKSFSKFGTVADEALSKYDELSAKLKELTQNATQNLSAFVEGYRGIEKESSNLVKTMSSLYKDSSKVLSGKLSNYQYYNSIFENASKNAEYYSTELSRLGEESKDLNNRMKAVNSRFEKKALGYSDEPIDDLRMDFAQVAHEIKIVGDSIQIAKKRYREYAIEVQSVQPYLTKAQDEYNEALENSNDIYAKYQEAVKNYTYLYEKTLKETSANLKEQNETLSDQIGIYKKLYTASNQYEKEMLGLNVLNTIKSQLMSVISDVANAGVTIGDTLISSILSGADSAGFLSNMKSYIKENMIKLAVYTESFQNMLADVGTK
jgi:phage-related minor tail protein